MKMHYISIFIISLFIIIVGEYLFYLSFNSLEILRYLKIEKIFFSLGIIVPIIFTATVIYSQKHFSKLNSWLYTVSALWIGVIFYLFMTSFIVVILIPIYQYFGINFPISLIIISILIIAFIISFYGVYNANNPKIVHFEVESKELSPLWKDKKIIFISDTHLGNMRGQKFMQKIVDIINSEKPDITFHLGDLIDGPSINYKKVFSPIENLNPPLGNYYTEGNHEGYSREYSVFKSNFPKNINDITGKKVILNGTQIIGIPYFKTKSKTKTEEQLNLVQYDKNMPSIILMHDPKNTPILAKEKVSLVLSGHTHAGQVFPVTILVKMFDGKYVHGVASTEETKSITSSGVGVAISPMRIGTIPEIVVLTIK
jgi:hypothetical protein